MNSRTGEMAAVKVFTSPGKDKRAEWVDGFKRWRDVLRELDHDNIVQFLDLGIGHSVCAMYALPSRFNVSHK